MQINSYSPQITQNNRQKATNFGSNIHLPNGLRPHNGAAITEFLKDSKDELSIISRENPLAESKKIFQQLSEKSDLSPSKAEYKFPNKELGFDKLIKNLEQKLALDFNTHIKNIKKELDFDKLIKKRPNLLIDDKDLKLEVPPYMGKTFANRTSNWGYSEHIIPSKTVGDEPLWEFPILKNIPPKKDKLIEPNFDNFKEGGYLTPSEHTRKVLNGLLEKPWEYANGGEIPKYYPLPERPKLTPEQIARMTAAIKKLKENPPSV